MPGLKYDGDKPRVSLLIDGCARALLEVGKVLTFGALKYKAHSWQTVDNGVERYRSALYRHELARAKGEYLDPESGLPHLAHIACNALFLLELDLLEKEKVNDIADELMGKVEADNITNAIYYSMFNRDIRIDPKMR